MNTIAILTVLLFGVGAIQGTVYGLILWNNQSHNQYANRILAVLLFLLSYRLIVEAMQIFGLGQYDIWYYFMLDLNWVNGALLFFYVKALITPNFKISRKDWIHFLPVVVQVAISIFVRLQNLYWDGTRESLSWLGYWGYVFWMNQPTIYVVASLLIIFYSIKALQLLQTPVQNIELKNERVRWIKTIVKSFKYYFAIVFLVLVLDFLVFKFTNYKGWYFYFTSFYYYPFFCGLAVLTYWIGLEGFKRRDEKGLIIIKEYEASKKSQLSSLAADIEKLMAEQKLFTNPQLTVSLLAEELKTKPYLISQCLKEVFHTKFTDYINLLRIEEVKRLLVLPQSKNLTLLAVAYDAGFNSKSSFNRAVKKQLGISPRELKEQIQGVN